MQKLEIIISLVLGKFNCSLHQPLFQGDFVGAGKTQTYLIFRENSSLSLPFIRYDYHTLAYDTHKITEIKQGNENAHWSKENAH